MKVHHQPEGMRTVSPYILVPQASQFIQFVETVFHGKLKYKLDRPDGSVMHAEMIVGDSIIMTGEPMEEGGAFPASIYIYVPDCDHVFERAVACGGTAVMEPANMRHAGERYGGVKDPFGNIWWIATHIEDLSPREQAERIQEMKENWD
ncbi:VOC family protein [Metabacillus sp. GX 13764]|uniref:VOC family protein n=1 Tax=Metabacillus kandeliae TaxID=2900151 RepID=UPI001E32C6C6|nr:VOC family protein [Metabacillus kandeliae]MCD7034861.1 VOC family protein [Metabacillus kandeliae]